MHVLVGARLTMRTLTKEVYERRDNTTSFIRSFRSLTDTRVGWLTCSLTHVLMFPTRTYSVPVQSDHVHFPILGQSFGC